MKKNIAVLFIILSFVLSVDAQETLNNITTLEQAKQKVDDAISSLDERLAKRELLISIPVDGGSEDIIDIRQIDDRPPFEFDDRILRERLLDYFSESDFSQFYGESLSGLSISNLDKVNILKQIRKGSLSDKEYLPQVQLRKIYYRAGSVQSLSESVVNGRVQNLKDLKPIDSLEVYINYTYPMHYRMIDLSENNIQYAEGKYFVILRSWGGKCIESAFSYHLASDSIISPTIVGITKYNDIVSPRSVRLTDLGSREVSIKFQYALTVLKGVQAKLDANQYATVDDFREDMKHKDKAITDFEKCHDSKIVSCFDEDIVSIKVYYPTKLDTINQTFVLRNKELGSRYYNSKSLVRTYNNKTRKYGFIDLSGNEVLPTQYGKIEYLGGKLFKEENSQARQSVCYKLDEKNKSLVKCDFMIGYIPSSDKDKKYIHIESAIRDNETSFSYKTMDGLVNLDGDVLVPTQYDGIPKVFYEDSLAVFSSKGKLGLYKFGVGEVLPPIYKNINIANNFIYTKRDSVYDMGQYELGDLFDFNLKQINPANWNLLSNSYFDVSLSDPLIRVRDKKTQKDFYMNLRGEMQIPPSDVYDYDADFNYGLAVVSKDSKYGYMNTKGKIVIPLVYNDASDYTGRSMFVQKGDDFMIIDANRKIIRKLKHDLSIFDRSKPGEPINTRYELKDGSVYDDDGILISEDKIK